MAASRAMSLPAILNECQRTMSADMHRKYARMLAPRRRAEPAELVEELLGLLRHALVVSKREPSVERLVRFVVALATEREAGDAGAEDDAFLEELLWALLPLAGAADRGVRFRVCQLVASLLHGLSNDAELTDELFCELGEAMTERLRDRAPAVRMQATRALARLQDPGEAGDFSEDATTAALLSLLECDKHKDVRRAVLASVGVSAVTVPALVERTRDNAEEVRRTAFQTVAAKVPLGDLSIAARATLLRRGLGDRAPSVRAAAVSMLGMWLKACGDDVVRLLGVLDVETHEAVAEMLLCELINGGALKPVDIVTNSSATGLRRTEEDGLLTPELALYWRVICEALSNDASALGSGAARGGGQAAAVAAASASEKLDALEAALPVTMVNYCELVRRHTSGGAAARFASTQLLRLATRQDMSDAAAARAAASLAEELLVQPPTPGSFGAGGRGDWERALVGFAVASLGNSAPETVYAAAAALCGGEQAGEAHWVQALGIVVPLLESAASLRAAGGPNAVRTLREQLILPAVQHATTGVRREGVRALGLLCMLEPPTASAIAVLRGAATCDARPVRTHAARALCDLALLHGPDKLDEALPSIVAEADAHTSAPLVPALLSWLLEPAAGLVAPTSGAADEEEEELRSVAAEGLAKLLLLDAVGSSGPDDALAAKALAQLLLLHLEVDEHAHPRLAQCLTVFFPTFAAASAAHKRCVAAAAPLALRESARRKSLPRLAAFIAQLMASAPSAADAGAATAATGAEALAKHCLREALYVQKTYGRTAVVKPYIGAMVRLAAQLPARAPGAFAFDGLDAVAQQCDVVHELLAHAKQARDSVTEKTLLKELNAMTTRLAALDGLKQADGLGEGAVLSFWQNMESWDSELGVQFPFAPAAAATGANAARPARASKASAAAKISAVAAQEYAPAARTRRAAVAPMATLSDSDSDESEASEDESDSDASSEDDVEYTEGSPAAPPAGKHAPAAPRAVLAANVR